MDGEQLLQHLRDLSLEEGRAYIQEHMAELADHDAVANLLADEAFRLMYTPFISLKLAELLISFGDYTGHLSSHALGLKAKGDVLMAIGHYQAAMDILDAARDEFQSLEDEGNAARSRISWIMSAAWIGRVEEALQEAARTRTVFQHLDESYWVGAVDNNTALIYADVGLHQEAAKLYEGMLFIFATANEQSESNIKRSTAMAQENYAQSLTLLGHFARAYGLLEQAQANFISLGEIALAVSVEHDLADLDYAQGYYGSALRRYYQAHDTLIQHSIDSPVLLAEIKLSMTNCLVKLNRSEDACLLSQEAVEVYRQLGLSFNLGKALREHATALVASRRLREALSALEEAQTLFTNGGFQPHAFAVRLQQAQILLEMGSATEAYETALQVKQYCEARSLVVRAVNATLIMAEALLSKARDAAAGREQEQQTLLEEAMVLCKEVAAQARERNLQEEIYRIHYLLGRISFLQSNLSGAGRHYRTAIEQIESILDDLIYDLSPSFLHKAWTVYEDMIALCLLQARFRQAFSYLEQARSMALRQYLSKAATLRASGEQQGDTSTLSLQQENNAMILRTEQELKDYQDRYHYFSMLLAQLDTTVSPDIDREVIQAELKRYEGKIGELFERLYLYQSGIGLKSAGVSRKKRSRTQSKRVDVVQLQDCLAPDQVLLEYFSYQGKLVVFAVTAQGLVTRELSSGMEQVERLLLLLHAHLDPGTWPDPHNPSQLAVRRLLNRLYDMLVKPVAELLPPPSGQLTIVPYGPLLHKLPFHALYDGSHFLIEHFRVSYLPTSTLLVHLEKLRHERVASALQLKPLAHPPLVLGYSENEHLQRVREEAQTIASLLHGRCYLENEATIARLVEQAPGSPVIHIATHGQSRLDAPNFSFVRLADGQLNAIDAFSLDLRACELVTLSGCETGLALSGGGDEQLGLGRAFLAAGTSSLVMSLWPVEDSATNELMQRFYEGLLKGEGKGEALRSAQCSLLRQTGSAHAHPYFWAAFRLVGDVGPLLYQQTEHTSAL